MKKNRYKPIKKINDSVLDIHEHLLTQYRMKVLEIEMNLHQARQLRMLNRTQRYFNSTPIRNAFARWMVFGAYTNRFYNISELVKEIHSNRQTISTIVSECEIEGFIIVKREGKTVKCQASPILVEKMEDYCEWRKDLTQSIISRTYDDLTKYEMLMKKNLT